MLEDFCTDRAGIYSVKPLVGHCQGAAAAIEIAAAAFSHESRLITAAPRVGVPTTSQLVNGREEHRGGVTVKSSLGMGGHNAVVVLDDAA
jgi:3-oxoacyl-[acyl-carrier-protein] synthase II